MKFLALTAFLSVTSAQLARGTVCAQDGVDAEACDVGLCCGEGVFESDVVDGVDSDTY